VHSTDPPNLSLLSSLFPHLFPSLPISSHLFPSPSYKLCALRPFDAQQCVRAVRLSANGEKCGRADSVLVPKDVLRQYYLPKASPCPVPALLGVPLYTCKVGPYCPLLPPTAPTGDSDNQWATTLNMMPDNGLAPYEWLTEVGPVMVFRPSEEPLSSGDVRLVHDYLWDLKDYYANGTLTPAHLSGEQFGRFKRSRLEEQRASYPFMEVYEDLHF
jgi:hypothetical protein